MKIKILASIAASILSFPVFANTEIVCGRDQDIENSSYSRFDVDSLEGVINSRIKWLEGTEKKVSVSNLQILYDSSKNKEGYLVTHQTICAVLSY